MKTFLVTTLVWLLAINQLSAQSYGNYDKVPFAFGIFPPLSTNGTNAGNCINQVSLNLISGYSAGLSGIEFAGFSNTERDFVRGAQFAGFGNFVNGDFTGFQFAGFSNFNRAVSRGFQFAGFANFNYSEAHGVLASGFANFTNGKSMAIQLAGFANFCEDVDGMQASGFANVVKGNGRAVQLAGFANITMGEVHGVQAAGFLNISKNKMEKVQAAGFMNAAAGDVEGLQLAGFGNFSRGHVDGAQISGFINVAKQLDGFQLGFINITDSLENGVPVGFLSFVRKNGFREFEFSASEAFNAQLAFKTGVKQFYNIFAIGSQFVGNDFAWGLGYGLGTHLIATDKFRTQLELMSFHVNENDNWTSTYNSLQQIKLNFSKAINENLSLFAGPTVNLMLSDNTRKDGQAFESHFAPYHLFSHKGDKHSLKGWIGLNIGLRIS
ncbi:hypothetical protein [Sunxiuqinia elliptica]|uniref:Uncharacterized protein n=1 Tax=Sunxiuqinia elliptica TaxID=655355 RepID=A0A1I2JDD6_9BACT|nr:hypothetical protein [Sunxiuqinia elliptica]SFF52862.1 hypothetical protein SAMN05216283_108159 [Sunxiuqinia elliptica]